MYRQKYLNADSCYRLPPKTVNSSPLPETWLYDLAKKMAENVNPALDPEVVHNHYIRHATPEKPSALNNSIREELEFLYHLLITAQASQSIIAVAASRLTEQLSACSDGFAVRVGSVAMSMNQPKSIDDHLYRIRNQLVTEIASNYQDQVQVGVGNEVHVYNWPFIIAQGSGFGIKPPNGMDSHHRGNQEGMLKRLNEQFDRHYRPLNLVNLIADDIKSIFQEQMNYRGITKAAYSVDDTDSWLNFLRRLIPNLPIEDIFICKDKDNYGFGPVIDINWTVVKNCILQALINKDYFKLDPEEKTALLWLLADNTQALASPSQNPSQRDLSILFAGQGFIANTNDLINLLSCIPPDAQAQKKALIGQYTNHDHQRLLLFYVCLDDKSQSGGKRRQIELSPVLLDLMLETLCPLTQLSTLLSNFLQLKPFAEEELKDKLTTYFQDRISQLRNQNFNDDDIAQTFTQELKQFANQIKQSAQKDKLQQILLSLPPLISSIKTLNNVLNAPKTLTKKVKESLLQSDEMKRIDFVCKNETLVATLLPYLPIQERIVLLKSKDNSGLSLLARINDPRFLTSVSELAPLDQEEILSTISTTGISPLMPALTKTPELAKAMLELIDSTNISTNTKIKLFQTVDDKTKDNALLASLRQRDPAVAQAAIEIIKTLPEKIQKEILADNTDEIITLAPVICLPQLTEMLNQLSIDFKTENRLEKVESLDFIKTILENSTNTQVHVQWLKAFFANFTDKRLYDTISSFAYFYKNNNRVKNSLINWLKEDPAAQDKLMNVILRRINLNQKLYYYLESLPLIALLPQESKVNYLKQTTANVVALSINFPSLPADIKEVLTNYIDLACNLNARVRFELMQKRSSQETNMMDLILSLRSKLPEKDLEKFVLALVQDLTIDQLGEILLTRESPPRENSLLINQLNRNLPRRPNLFQSIFNQLKPEEIPQLLIYLQKNAGHQDWKNLINSLPMSVKQAYIEATLVEAFSNPSNLDFLRQYMQIFNQLPESDRLRLLEKPLDRDGNTLLHFWAKSISPEEFETLVKAACPPNDIQAHLERENKNKESVKEMILQQWKPSVSSLDSRETCLKLQTLLKQFGDKSLFSSIFKQWLNTDNALNEKIDAVVNESLTEDKETLQAIIDLLPLLPTEQRLHILRKKIDAEGNHLLLWRYKNQSQNPDQFVIWINSLAKDIAIESQEEMTNLENNLGEKPLDFSDDLHKIQHKNYFKNVFMASKILLKLKRLVELEAFRPKIFLDLINSDDNFKAKIKNALINTGPNYLFIILPILHALPKELTIDYFSHSIKYYLPKWNNHQLHAFFTVLRELDPQDRIPLLKQKNGNIEDNLLKKIEKRFHYSKVETIYENLLNKLRSDEVAELITQTNKQGEMCSVQNISRIKEANIKYRLRLEFQITESGESNHQAFSDARNKLSPEEIITKGYLSYGADDKPFIDALEMIRLKINTMHKAGLNPVDREKSFDLHLLYRDLSEKYFEYKNNECSLKECRETWKDKIYVAKTSSSIKKHSGLKDFFVKLLALIPLGIPAMIISKNNNGFFSKPITETNTVKLLNTIDNNLDNELKT